MGAPRDTRNFRWRVAQRIKAAREAKGLTQEALAERLGISPKTFQPFESGRENLGLDTIERIAISLGVAPESLFTAELGSVSDNASVLTRIERAGYAVRSPMTAGRKPAHAVPIYDAKAAAGAIHGDSRVVEKIGFVILDRPPPGAFVAEIRGDSMEPRVPDRAICLFRRLGARSVRDSLSGRVVLVEHRRFGDTELGGNVALKMIDKVERLPGGRARVTLNSVNTGYDPIVITLDDPDELRLVGELHDVLVPPISAKP